MKPTWTKVYGTQRDPAREAIRNQNAIGEFFEILDSEINYDPLTPEIIGKLTDALGILPATRGDSIFPDPPPVPADQLGPEHEAIRFQLTQDEPYVDRLTDEEVRILSISAGGYRVEGNLCSRDRSWKDKETRDKFLESLGFDRYMAARHTLVLKS